jgi:hypothetical protein
VSVLRERIVADAAPGPEYTHPYGTSATPMVMPLARVTYGPIASQYEDMHPLPASGDVNAVPMAVVAPGPFGKVVPSGRP